MAQNQQKKTIYRDSITGRIIKQWVAEMNPKTTERERVRVGKRKPRG